LPTRCCASQRADQRGPSLQAWKWVAYRFRLKTKVRRVTDTRLVEVHPAQRRKDVEVDLACDEAVLRGRCELGVRCRRRDPPTYLLIGHLHAVVTQESQRGILPVLVLRAAMVMLDALLKVLIGGLDLDLVCCVLDTQSALAGDHRD
jgi:hypothetical protein